MKLALAEALKSYNGHDAECLCTNCLMADMDNHIITTRGEEALDRINVQMSAIGGGKVEAVKTRSMKAGQRVGRGVVRGMSPKQRKYLLVLIDTKDTSGLKLLPGQTINLKEIDTMGLPAAKAVIDKLQGCPDKPSNSPRMATEGQKRFIRSLNAQSDNTLSEDDINSITFAEVNDVLALLKRMAQAWREEGKSNPTKAQVTEGAYWVNGKIARVQKSKKGYLYATLQTERGVNDFEYVRGLISKIRPEDMLTREEMQEFAAEFSQCGDCGRRLTNPESIAYGIGPICRNKGYR